MGTNIYTTDGRLLRTRTPYETVRSWLLDNQRPCIEVPDNLGNNHLIPIRNITNLEEIK